MQTQVLITGAGPAGLVLALWLAKSRVPFRIVEQHAGPGEASRAMAVQARTLEFYRQLGIVEKVVAAGIPMTHLHFREDMEERASVEFGNFGQGLSPYPFALSYPQDDHERLLVEELRANNVEVEWNTRLVSFRESEGQIRANLLGPAGVEECDCSYLCGCDGAHSTVRETLGLTFPGGTYEQLFFVADLEAAGIFVNGDINLCLGKQTLYVVFPLRRPGMCRLIGTVPIELSNREQLNYDDLRTSVEEHVQLRATKVNWFSIYRVHHRVTDRFRVGRAFIAGDAAHIHSPAGGQGMNTGIGDAVNLAWKLAAVVQGRASESILDSYEPERTGFAHSLVATTDRLFQGMVGKSMGAEVFRSVLLPHVLPWLLGLSSFREAQFKLVSQVRIHYPESPLSAGAAGAIQGGDRLPWAADLDNFAPLKSLEWQLHVYGEPSPSVARLTRRRQLPLHRFDWSQACSDAGLQRNACYLVRPDGYVSAAGISDDIGHVESILDAFKIVAKH